MTAHLGARVDDLVDGRLDHDSRDLAHAHLMVCAPCRREVETTRALKGRLWELAAPPVSATLTERLGLIADPPPARFDRQPPRLRPGRARPPSWRGGLFAAAAAVVGAAAVALMLVAPGSRTSTVPSPTATFTVDRTGGSWTVDGDAGAAVTTSLRTRP